MMQHVVADLVAHHREDLVLAQALERRVPQHDALRGAEAADVGVDGIRLAAAIDLEHMTRRNPRAPGKRQDAVVELRVAERLKRVERGLEHERRQQHAGHRDR